MKCPFCSFADTQVKDSRPSEDGLSIKRRRQCPNCGGRFTTFERQEIREVRVLKRNQEIRPFDATKLTRSIEVACRKRPVKGEQIEQAVTRIMHKIDKFGEGEVPTKIIGDLVLEELRNIDEVAYVRYASVYKEFAKLGDFGNFIAKPHD